jgi:FkbM family methyltransferase
VKSRLLLIRLNKLIRVIRFPLLRKALMRHGVLGGAEHKPVFAVDFRTVVDVGANRGQFALAAREWAPEAGLIGFEPLSGPAAIFRKVFNGDCMVTLHQVAIGPEAGSIPIHVAAADDSSSILPASELYKQIFPGTDQVRKESIRVGRLIEFLSSEEIIPPALLKLDVQGFELEALAGCKELLEHFSHVYVECSFMELYSGQALADEVIDWLAGWRFRLSGIYNLCYDKKGNPIQGDFLFANKSSKNFDEQWHCEIRQTLEKISHNSEEAAQ